MTPYVIQGDNLPHSETHSQTQGGSFLVQETHSLSSTDILNKSFTLAHSVADGQEHNVSASLNGIVLDEGADFFISSNSVAWNGKALDAFSLLPDDVFTVTYTSIS